MSLFHSTAAAALTALAALAAHATEATQWDPRTDATVLPAVHEAALAPMAWTVGRGEATQFRDGVARDTMVSRAKVRDDLRQARSRHLLADTGEAGPSDRVVAQRASIAASDRDPELAQNIRLQTSDDPIGELAALTSPPDIEPDAAMFALAADDRPLRLPSNQNPLDESLTVVVG